MLTAGLNYTVIISWKISLYEKSEALDQKLVDFIMNHWLKRLGIDVVLLPVDLIIAQCAAFMCVLQYQVQHQIAEQCKKSCGCCYSSVKLTMTADHF